MLMVFLKEFFKNVDFEKNQQTTKKHEELPRMQRVNSNTGYRSTSPSQSPREWRKQFELSKVRHKQNVTSPKYDVHVQFLQDILLQYMCSKTIRTENRIEMKTKEILFKLFYFHFNYVVDRPDTTALARNKQHGGNGDFFKSLVIGKW